MCFSPSFPLPGSNGNSKEWLDSLCPSSDMLYFGNTGIHWNFKPGFTGRSIVFMVLYDVYEQMWEGQYNPTPYLGAGGGGRI